MTTPQIPDAFSNVFGLGASLAYYPAKRGSRWGNLIVMLLLFSGAGAALLWGAYNAYTRYLKFGPAVVVPSLTGPWILAVTLFVVALLLAWGALSNWNKAAVVYQSGLAYRDRKGLKSWRWDEISSLTSAVTKHYTNGIYTGTTHVYTLFKKDGEKLVLNDTLTNVEELAAAVGEQLFPLLYEEIAGAYNQGTLCTFGPVQISKTDGIQIGKKAYPWNEIEQVAIQKGTLSVKKKGGGWFSGATATASSIPNLEVMLAIIDQVTGLKTG
ncbi:MAG TPA: hypothetical protein DEH25_03525 [Chloroflexi bacterium]|nr:hypothetical protein [Chloroflexota bacterium]